MADLAIIQAATPPVPIPAASAGALAQFRPRVASYVQQSRSSNTLRGYRADWRHFSAFCFEHDLISLPAAPETVCAYLSACADSGHLKSGSIQRRVSAIAANHTAVGFDSPTGKAAVKLTLAGIRRALGIAQEGKQPVLTADITDMLKHIPDTLLGIRDRAIILIGFAGAFRRSELVGLDIEDIDFREDGAKVTIRKSKTDQEGAGQVIGIARGSKLCPVRALEEWLTAAGITAGPIFRPINRHGRVKARRLNGCVVALAVQRYAKAAGLDPSKYAGHSLRAGLVTQAFISGVQEHTIMKQTRHKSSDMLRKYCRDASLFRENASARVGL